MSAKAQEELERRIQALEGRLRAAPVTPPTAASNTDPPPRIPVPHRKTRFDLDAEVEADLG